MKRAVLIGLVGLSIAACGGAKFRAKTQPTIARDGGGAWIAECRDTVSCWQVLAWQCPNGYDVLEGDSQAITQTDARFATGSSSERTTRSKTLQLMVRCRSYHRQHGIVLR